MAENWAEDVKKYVKDADDDLIAAIIRYCGIALRSRDSSLVSFSDPTELARVRDNFLKKKLGLTEPDDALDAAIAAVGKKMKGDSSKNRVTVYYLLLDQLGAHGRLAKAKPKAAPKAVAEKPAKAAPAEKPAKAAAEKPVKPAKSAAAATGAGALGLASLSGTSKSAGTAKKATVSLTEKPETAAKAATTAAKKATSASKGAASAAVKTAATNPKKSASAGKDAAAGGSFDGAAGNAAPVVVDKIADSGSTAAENAGSAVAGAAAALTGGSASGVQAPTAKQDDDSNSGLGWLWWVLLALLAAFLIWWVFLRGAPS